MSEAFEVVQAQTYDDLTAVQQIRLEGVSLRLSPSQQLSTLTPPFSPVFVAENGYFLAPEQMQTLPCVLLVPLSQLLPWAASLR